MISFRNSLFISYRKELSKHFQLKSTDKENFIKQVIRRMSFKSMNSTVILIKLFVHLYLGRRSELLSAEREDLK